MNIGELFISLGIKDADKAAETLKDVQTKLSSIQKFKMPQMQIPQMQMPHIFPIKQDNYWNKINDKVMPSFAKSKEDGTAHGGSFWSGFKKHANDAKKNLENFFKVKPSEKTPKALDQVQTGLKGITSMSLEAKAAIVGAIYALDRLFTASGQRGTAALNLSALLGGDTQILQRYQYVATMAGSSNEELASTFMGLSDSMGKLTTTGVAPQFWGQLQRRVGGISAEDVRNFTVHPEMLFQRLQTYAQIEKDVGVRNQVLESFVGKSMAALLIRRKFTPEALAAAPTYSENQIKKLDESRAAWADVFDKISRMFGRLNVRYGKQLADDIKQIIPHVEKLVNAFANLADKLHIMQLIDTVIKGWGLIFDAMTKGVDSLNTLLNSTDEKKKQKILDELPSPSEALSIGGQYIEFFSDKIMKSALLLAGKSPKHADDILSKAKQDVSNLSTLFQKIFELDVNKSNVIPIHKNLGKTSSVTNYNVNQNLSFLTKEHDKHEIAQIVHKTMSRHISNAIGNYPLVENS